MARQVENERHGAAEERRKQKRKQGKEERGRRINSIFCGAPCIPHPPCGPGARAHVSTLAHICFCYYMIGCGENIGKLYVRWEGGGTGRGGGVKAGASSPTMSSTFPSCICPHEVFQSCLWGPALSSLSITYSSPCKKKRK